MLPHSPGVVVCCCRGEENSPGDEEDGGGDANMVEGEISACGGRLGVVGSIVFTLEIAVSALPDVLNQAA